MYRLLILSFRFWVFDSESLILDSEFFNSCFPLFNSRFSLVDSCFSILASRFSLISHLLSVASCSLVSTTNASLYLPPIVPSMSLCISYFPMFISPILVPHFRISSLNLSSHFSFSISCSLVLVAFSPKHYIPDSKVRNLILKLSKHCRILTPNLTILVH